VAAPLDFRLPVLLLPPYKLSALSFHLQEHCFIGIKGTVRRSTDGHVIHANIDTDIILTEERTDGILFFHYLKMMVFCFLGS
jgi:hypothetical protein